MPSRESLDSFDTVTSARLLIFPFGRVSQRGPVFTELKR